MFTSTSRSCQLEQCSFLVRSGLRMERMRSDQLLHVKIRACLRTCMAAMLLPRRPGCHQHHQARATYICSMWPLCWLSTHASHTCTSNSSKIKFALLHIQQVHNCTLAEAGNAGPVHSFRQVAHRPRQEAPCLQALPPRSAPPLLHPQHVRAGQCPMQTGNTAAHVLKGRTCSAN
jgi:hypothetical protein